MATRINTSLELKFKPAHNKHYILINSSNHIIDGWSDGPHPEKEITNAICINEQGGYQFRLFPNGEENPSLFDINLLPLYKYEDGEVIPLSQVEKNIAQILQDNKNLPTIKLQLIVQSKEQLAQYLERNPLTWIDKKQYSVTQEKQSLLTEQLALYAMDNNTPLYWNASGEECHIWEITELAALAKAIANYVRPYIQYQQRKESEINETTTAEDARNIVINYETLE